MNNLSNQPSNIADRILDCARTLNKALKDLQFAAPVTHVYNPLEYAWAPFEHYVRKFAPLGQQNDAQIKRGRAVLLGMNPGPYGMMQVGVPFGEVSAVREWMGISDAVSPPKQQHPKRPIQGFACTRSEVSGKRLWAMAQEDYGTAEQFFEHFFVLNYCPLVWLQSSGKNHTPDMLPSTELTPVYKACDEHLARVIDILEPTHAVGIGAFAMKRLQTVLGKQSPIAIGTILHPSPASPMANRGWAEQARQQLMAQGLASPRLVSPSLTST
jgi:single-strand selective monofunctional uracil DNA glycosylase